jgi:predicted dinucleotide-binding enzyme
MKIGIIGAGNVGGALGKGWAKKGHAVMLGVRDASDPKVVALLKDVGANARVGSVAEAGKFGEVVVFATPWPATRDAVRGAGDLRGKIVFDCTNPLKPDLSGLEMGLNSSAGEQVANWAPAARVVKIFNTTGAGNMGDTRYPAGAPTMFYCGDDADAKAAAAQLATDLGFEAMDAGGLTVARLLEPYAMLWIHLAIHQGWGVNFAFKVMRR